MIKNVSFVSRFAGSGRQGLEDGSLAEASFAQPNGIAALGNTLYVNNIDGPWRTFGAGQIVVRKIILPAVF